MAIRSGFFNSVNGDRKYDASRFAEYFASFIGNGVFPNPSDNLQVIANNNMTVTVRPGKAWINGYILINDDDYILTLDTADGVLDRIDRIIVRYNVAAREIQIEVKKGEISSNPTAPDLQRDADAYELALADIYIAAGTTSITQANITDLRLNTELCGIVHGTVEQVNTTTLFNQYLTWLQEKKTQYDNDMINWTSQKQAEFEDWTTAQEQDFENWRMQEEQNFNDWFHSIQDMLDENVATTILNMIGDLSNLTTADKSSLVNAINEVNAKEVDLTPIEDQIADLEDDFESHKNESTQQAHLAKNIGLEDTAGNFVSTELEGAMQELFTNVSNGKQLVGGAITDVDDSVVIPTDPTFIDLASAIRNISTGKKWASGTTTAIFEDAARRIKVLGLDFTPSFIMAVRNPISTNPNHTNLFGYADFEGNVYCNALENQYEIYADGFRFRVDNVADVNFYWIAFE